MVCERVLPWQVARRGSSCFASHHIIRTADKPQNLDGSDRSWKMRVQKPPPAENKQARAVD